MESIKEKRNYIDSLNSLSPFTLFQWTFYLPGKQEFQWTRCRTYKESNQAVFWNKETIYRSTIWTKHTDELRLDLDYNTLEENKEKASLICSRLEELNINKYLVYQTGGKGIHITLRFKFDFDSYDRQDIRASLYECLNLGVEIDKTLFRTTQVIGCEGFKHRKTLKAKRLLDSDKTFNIDYLGDSFVNALSDDLVQDMIKSLSPTNSNQAVKLVFKDTPPAFYKDSLFDFHIDRFKFIYLNIEDGRKRVLDMLVRYLYLTTKNEEVTRYYYKLFIDDLGINYNIDKIKRNVAASINGMRAKAIFIYKDLFDKNYFYETLKRGTA